MKKKNWFAVQKSSEDEWGYGSFDWDEAVSMANSDERYTLIAKIDGNYDENGNATSDTECVAEYYKGKDF